MRPRQRRPGAVRPTAVRAPRAPAITVCTPGEVQGLGAREVAPFSSNCIAIATAHAHRDRVLWGDPSSTTSNGSVCSRVPRRGLSRRSSRHAAPVSLYLQIVGKVRVALARPLNHWWHVTLYVNSRGLTTATSRAMKATSSGVEQTESLGVRLSVVDRAAAGRGVEFEPPSCTAWLWLANPATVRFPAG